MKRFIRENPTIAFGLGLPLLFVVFFSLAAAVQERGATPPAYDVIYAENYVQNGYGLAIEVRNRKAVVTYRQGAGYCCNGALKLVRFSPRTGAVRKISVSVPPELAPDPAGRPPYTGGKTVPVAVPELDGLTLDDASVAPDGYAFRDDEAYHGGGLFTELFIGGRPSRRAVLAKGWSRVSLPESACCGPTHLVGWVIAP